MATKTQSTETQGTEAQNNERITFEQFQQMQQQQDELRSRNKFELSGIVTDFNALDISAKTDKQGKAINDADGNPTFWDPMYWVNIAVLGSEEGVLLNAEQVNEIEAGKYYMFGGYLKNRKMKVKTITAI